jgi:hypothetical protein
MGLPGDSTADLHRDMRAFSEGDLRADSRGDCQSDFPADSHRDSDADLRCDSQKDLQGDLRGDFDSVSRTETECRAADRRLASGRRYVRRFHIGEIARSRATTRSNTSTV